MNVEHLAKYHLGHFFNISLERNQLIPKSHSMTSVFCLDQEYTTFSVIIVGSTFSIKRYLKLDKYKVHSMLKFVVI